MTKKKDCNEEAIIYRKRENTLLIAENKAIEHIDERQEKEEDKKKLYIFFFSIFFFNE